MDYSVLDTFKDGRRVCRNPDCDTLLPIGRRRWCSKVCENATYKKFSWGWVRFDVFVRDRRCLYPGCGEEIPESEGGYLRVDWWECHHIVSVEELKRAIGRNFKGSGSDFFWAMLEACLDKGNLVTICSDCHKKLKHFKPTRKRFDSLDRDSSLAPWSMRYNEYAVPDRRILARLKICFDHAFPVYNQLTWDQFVQEESDNG